MKRQLLPILLGLFMLGTHVFAQHARSITTESGSMPVSSREAILSSSKEKAPNTTNSSFNGVNKLNSNSRAAWDFDFSFNVSGPAHAGVVTDGSHFYTTAWNGNTFTRYDMDGTNPVDFTIEGVSGIRDMTYDGQYFYGSAVNLSIFQMDLENEALISTIPVSCTGVSGVRHIAYDPTLDGGNGGFWVGDWDELGAINMSGAELIANVGQIGSCYGMTYDPWTDSNNPVLWAFSQTSPNDVTMHKFDINTLSLTDITVDLSATTGYDDGIAGGACSFVANATYYVAACFQQDPNLIAVYNVAQTAAPAAPNAVTNLEVAAGENGALMADIWWTNPEINAIEETLTELTSIELFINDSETAEYTDNSPVIGANESYQATLTEIGMHTFRVVGSNASGTGIPNSVSVWIGEDVPVAPANIVLAKDEMDATLTWEAPTAGVHAAYFTGNDLKYTIVRYPGAVVVSENQTELTFTETIAESQIYYYKITASNNSGVGLSDNSNSLIFGDIVYFDFESGLPENAETIDGECSWLFGDDGASVWFNIAPHDGNYAYINEDECNGEMSDVWLILPPLSFEGISNPWMTYDDFRAFDEYTIKISTDGNDWTDLLSLGEGNQTWQEIYIDLVDYANEELVFIAFHYNDLGDWGYGWAIDNVIINGKLVEITCPKPSNLSASDITTNSALLSWTETGTATVWEIEYGLAGFQIGNGTLVTEIATNSYALQDLEDASLYSFYVRASCSENENSFWSNPFTFSTECFKLSTIPFTENFEDGVVPPTCWSVKNTHPHANSNWDHYIDEDGITCAEVNYSDNQLMDEWLISPTFDLSNVTEDLKLTFDFFGSHYWMVDEDGADVFVKISTDGGETWTNIWQEYDHGEFENWTWQSVSIVFPYAGQDNVKFAFNYYGNDGAQFFVTNVSLSKSTDISENSLSKVDLYPNPSNGQVTITNVKDAMIEIYSITGQIVSQFVANGNIETIDLSNVNHGTYFVRIISNEGTSIKKLQITK